MYQQPVNPRIPHNVNTTPSSSISCQNVYQNRQQISTPPYSNPPVSYPQHGYPNLPSNLGPPPLNTIHNWNPAQQHHKNTLYPSNNAQYSSQDKSYTENGYTSVQHLPPLINMNDQSHQQNQYFQNVSTSYSGKQIPMNSSNSSQQLYNNQMFMKDHLTSIHHQRRSNIQLQNQNKQVQNPGRLHGFQNSASITRFTQELVQNQQQSTVQSQQPHQHSLPRKHHPLHQHQAAYGKPHQQSISEQNVMYPALLDASSVQEQSGNSYSGIDGPSDNQSSFGKQSEAQRTWYRVPNQENEVNLQNSLKIQSVVSIPESNLSQSRAPTASSQNNPDQSFPATQARIKREKAFSESECINRNSDTIKSTPSTNKVPDQDKLLAYILNCKPNTTSTLSPTNVEPRKTDSKQIQGSEISALPGSNGQFTISSGPNISTSKSTSPLDEKSREAALRDLKRLHRRDQSISGNLEENIFRKPKEKGRRHSSSDKSKSPSSRICPSPDSTILPENSRGYAVLSPSRTTDMDDLNNLSPCSDTTVAYCDGKRIDELDPADKSPPSLKRVLGEVEESICKRQRLLGYGTECDSTNELFSESLESNNIDRLTPLKQTVCCSGTGCVSIKNTNIRYCILDDKKFFVWKDFKFYYRKFKDLFDENICSSHLCSETDAQKLSLDFKKLPAVQEGDKLYSFKVTPGCFEENVLLNENYCDNSEDLTGSAYNTNTAATSHDNSYDFVSTWLRTSTTGINVGKTNTGCNRFMNGSESAKDMKAELEKISTMPQDVIKTFFLNMMEECVKLKEENNQLKQRLHTQTSHNKSLHEMLEKTASLLKK